MGTPEDMKNMGQALSENLRGKLSVEDISLPVRVGQETVTIPNKNALGLFLFALHESRPHQLDTMKIPPIISIFLTQTVGTADTLLTFMYKKLKNTPALEKSCNEALASYCPVILGMIQKHAHALQMANLLEVETTGLLSEAALPLYPDTLESPLECAVLLEHVINGREEWQGMPYVQEFMQDCNEVSKGKRQQISTGHIKAATHSILEAYHAQSTFTDAQLAKQMELIEQFIRRPHAGAAISSRKNAPHVERR